MPPQREDIPKGTLELLILRTLGLGKPMHGFEVADFIQETSTGVLQVEEGSLYPALQAGQQPRAIDVPPPCFQQHADDIGKRSAAQTANKPHREKCDIGSSCA